VETPESLLRQQGLSPLTWDEVLLRTERQLTPVEAGTFQRLHRALAAYPTAHTVRSFYDFAAGRGLLPLLASFRFDRLVNITAALALQNLSGKKVLDFGAGSGALAGPLVSGGAIVVATDFSSATLRHLEARGLRTVDGEHLGEEAPFAVILCADSLGEIHADEDDWLSNPVNLDHPDFPGELEARYGFAEKLSGLRPLLAENGVILIFEPVALSHFWQGAARALEASGWKSEVLGPAPVWGLKLQTARN
jgi:SAM-dependent methyltransferase